MNNGPTISIGSTGRDVRRLQRLFVMMKVLAPGNITGTFDSTTEQAVKDFQQGAGLTVDGIVGPITWQALPADPNTPLLRRGMSGSVVTALQKGLKKYSTPATDPGAVDGDFGAQTEAAVQRDRHEKPGLRCAETERLEGADAFVEGHDSRFRWRGSNGVPPRRVPRPEPPAR